MELERGFVINGVYQWTDGKYIPAARSIIRWAEMENLCGRTRSVMKESLKMTEVKKIHIEFKNFLGDISDQRLISQFLI